MALSKKDLMINITMNELYNTHALILQHIDALVSFIGSTSIANHP
jgi:Ras GTPase-activating-like protein IQGAP2/3